MNAPSIRPDPRTGLSRDGLLDWLHAATRLQRRHLDAILRKAESAHPEPPAAYSAAPLDPNRAGDQSDGFEITAFSAHAPSAAKPRFFVKQLNDPRYHEAWHYLALHQVHAPIPRLHGWMANPDGREVLFMEHVRIDLRDDTLTPSSADYEAFIRLIARFNSLRPPERYTSQLPVADLPGILEDTLPAVRTLASQGRRGALGPEVAAFLARPEHTRGRLLAQVQALAAAVHAMPRGLIHGDLFPRHVGVRRGAGEWLVIDLLYTQMGPRYFDVSPFLGAPPDASPLTRARRRHLAAAYLESSPDAPHSPHDADALLAEAETLWLAWEFRNIRHWILSALEEPKHSASPDGRRWLLHRLTQLMARRPV